MSRPVHPFAQHPPLGWVLDALDRCALHEVLEVLEQHEPEPAYTVSDLEIETEMHPTPLPAPEREWSAT